MVARGPRHKRIQARVVAVAEGRLAAVGAEVVAREDEHLVQRLGDGRLAVGGARPQVRHQHQLERPAVVRGRRLEVRTVAADLTPRLGGERARGLRLPAARVGRTVERQPDDPYAHPVAEEVIGGTMPRFSRCVVRKCAS